MTKTLLLLRHAKSSWEDSDLADHARPLNNRGRTAARNMAPHVAAWQPQWIGCSTAQRTRETLQPIVAALETPCVIELTPALYESPEAAYLRLIRNLGGPTDRALIIGHNPTLAGLVATLAGSAEPAAYERVADKLPTGTLTVLACDIARWSDLSPGAAHLADATRPADI